MMTRRGRFELAKKMVNVHISAPILVFTSRRHTPLSNLIVQIDVWLQGLTEYQESTLTIVFNLVQN